MMRSDLDPISLLAFMLVLPVVTPVCHSCVGSLAPAPVIACPLTKDRHGYPLAASTHDSVAADSAFLSTFARAAAYRWKVPSNRRVLYTGWQRVRARLLPPEPRWADDWRPKPEHVARLTVTLYAGSRAPTVIVLQPSGDKRFDESLRSMVLDPMPGAPALPAMPEARPDSLLLMIHVGERPNAPAQAIEFAVEQKPVRIVSGTLRVLAPPTSRSPRATVKYDVGVDGAVIPGSFELLESSDTDFARAVEDALRRARFTPAESNCRPIAMSVVQTFGS